MTTEHAARVRGWIAAIEAAMTGTTAGDEASDGPDEPCIAEADLEWMADRECDREERWRSAS